MSSLQLANRMIQLFQQYDVDGGGAVEKEQLLKVLAFLNVCSSHAKRALESHEDKVCYADFVDWVLLPDDMAAVECRKVVLLLGPPACGKSTLAPKVAEHLAIPKLAINDLLRAAVSLGSALGRQVQGIINRGGAVPDHLLIQLIQLRIRFSDCKVGFILDGFPETLNQAKLLDNLLAESGDEVTVALVVDVPLEKLYAQRTGRWSHEASGRAYHLEWAQPTSLEPGERPSHENMRDDITGEPLTPAAAVSREQHEKELKQYWQDAGEIVGHYGDSVRRLKASGMPAETWRAFQGVLSHLKR